MDREDSYQQKKTMKITIYGASDDLIEIEGDITEEFDACGDGTYIGCSDGTLLFIDYNRHGFWRINILSSGTSKITRTDGTDENNDYSDKVTLEGDIKWLTCGSGMVKLKNKRN